MQKDETLVVSYCVAFRYHDTESNIGSVPRDAWTPHVSAGRHLVKRSTYCCAGWFPFHGRCFRYNPTALSWAAAEVTLLL